MLIFFKLTTLNAQDIIVLNNTEEIKSRVIEILDGQVKYKKWTNLNGPSYAIDKSEIFMIKYANGEKETFKNIEKKEPKTKVAIAEPIIVEKLENICLKINKKVIYENEKIEVENCSKDGSSFQLETGDGETTDIALNESIDIPFKKAGVYTIRLTAYTKNKKAKKVVTEEVTVMSNFKGACDIRVGYINPFGDFGNQNYFGSNSNPNSAVTGGLALEYNADFNVNENLKFRTLINLNVMTFKPFNDYSDATVQVTENQYNSVKSTFLGIGLVYKTYYNSKRNAYGELGFSLGWFGLNPNNQYFNFYYPQIGENLIMGLEPTGISNGFGFQLNSDVGFKLSKNFDLFIATDFFHSNVTEEFKLVFFSNGTKSSGGETVSNDKSVNFMKQTLGIRFNY